jgi:hypothetical protein
VLEPIPGANIPPWIVKRDDKFDGPITLRVWSLLAIMHNFDAWGLAMLLHHMEDLRDLTTKMCALDGRDERVPEEVIGARVLPTLMQAQHHAQHAHLQSTNDRVWDGGGPFWMAAKVGLTWQQLQNELVFLRQCIEADLEKRLFVFVEPKKVDLFAELDKIWGEVLTTIPDSKTDIEDGVLAYMVELNTAAVFHMMRVAEYGLRILAKKMHVSLALVSNGHILPIDYAEWEKVITAVKNKIDQKRQQLSMGPKRQAQLEKYSDAADHCTFMKDIWRNTVSHARKPYNSTEALAVYERVRDFMRFVGQEFV